MTILYVAAYIFATWRMCVAIYRERWGLVMAYLSIMIILGLAAGGSMGGANG